MKIRGEFLSYLQVPLVQAPQLGLPAMCIFMFHVSCGNEEWHEDKIIFLHDHPGGYLIATDAFERYLYSGFVFKSVFFEKLNETMT